MSYISSSHCRILPCPMCRKDIDTEDSLSHNEDDDMPITCYHCGAKLRATLEIIRTYILTVLE